MDSYAVMFTQIRRQLLLAGQVQAPLVCKKLENGLNRICGEVFVHLHHIPPAQGQYAGEIVSLQQNFPVNAVVVLNL